MRKVEPSQVAVAADACVANFDRVRTHIAYLCRPDKKAIVIELETRSIIVEMETALNCVSLANEILAKEISDVDVLVTGVESIQAAVRVLLQHGKEGCIVLVMIVAK